MVLLVLVLLIVDLLLVLGELTLDEVEREDALLSLPCVLFCYVVCACYEGT